ncbi:DUF2283 domain-containing protein [Methanolobus sp.]|uniref:DUF2283 domain-containing protein n=1 Tax=Methanolobus sp. TaxID=1874737 RepID=UPI0025DC8AD0|nr:DUF2283 domain-containing protein [Methanolobus sp.]
MGKTRIKIKGDAADYDMQNDSFFAYSKGMKYKSSIDLDGIVIDISEENSIMGVEILEVSDKFGISKYDVKNYKALNMNVKISKKMIRVELVFSVLKRNAPTPHVIQASALNSMNLPVGSESLAVVA